MLCAATTDASETGLFMADGSTGLADVPSRMSTNPPAYAASRMACCHPKKLLPFNAGVTAPFETVNLCGMLWSSEEVCMSSIGVRFGFQIC